MVESGFKSRSSDLRDFVLTHSWMEAFVIGCIINCIGPDCLRTSEKGKSLLAGRVKEGFYGNRRKDL